jgi:hypothetical protein
LTAFQLANPVHSSYDLATVNKKGLENTP